MWAFVGVIAVAAPLFALADFVQMRLVLAWRTHLTEVLVGAFFADRAYYRVQHLAAIDNPDQRLCQDITSFAESSTSILSVLVSKFFSCVAFAGAQGCGCGR